MKSPTWNGLPRYSKKKLKANGGKLPSRTVTGARKPIKKKSRSASEFARIYGSRARVAWVKTLGCVVSNPVCATQPIDNAHTRTGGTSRKANAETIAPICRWHHRELHRIGQRSFEQKYYLNLASEAAQTEREWQNFVAAGAPGV